MQLDGIGGNTVNFSNNSSAASQIGSNKDRPIVEDRVISSQERRIEEKKPIVEEKIYTEDEVLDIIDKANKEFVAYDRKFQISVHEKTRQIMVKVLDSVTDEIIKELPPEKVLDIIAGLWEVAGIIVDKRI